MDISNLIVHAEPWQWAALAGTALGLTALLYGWGKDRPSPTWLLALLRLSILSILGFLLLNPMLRTTTETREAPVLPIVVDATSSQWMGQDSAARRAALDQLVAALPSWGTEQQWDVDLFTFDRTLNEWDDTGWAPRGKRTDLGSALESVRDRYVHRNVPAVVVVTDGRANRGPDPEFTADRLDVPHVFVGTGDTALVTDLEVSKLRLNEVAYLGNAFPVEVTAQARGAVGVPLTLRLASGNTVLETTTWTPVHPMSSTRWTVQVDAERAGPMTLQASIAAPGALADREVTRVNNRKRATIDVLESRRRILLVANAPHPDVAAIRNAAEANRHQETEVVWASELGPNTSLPEHDVLVLHQVNPTQMSSAVIEALTATRAVWVMGGTATTWNDWDLNLVGFQHAPEPLLTEAQGHRVRTFEPFPLPSQLESMLALWPPLACPTGAYNLTPALVPALNQQVGPVATDWPLWAVKEGDNRRVAVTLGEGLWRWRMQDVVRHDGESQVFDDLVNRTLQYLSSRDDVRRLRISAPERLDEDVRCEFVAEVYDVSLSPTIDVDVELTLTPDGGEPTRHRFVASPRGTDFSLDLGMLLPGVYEWVASCTQAGDPLAQRGTLVVNAVQAEASLVPANHGVLMRVADRTQGAFLGALHTAADLPNLEAAWREFASSLTTQDVLHTTSERLPLYAQLWLLVALLALLTSEWALRRAGGGR